MISKRSYDEGCAAAHALDLVGERWALLVVRELLLGPKRFTDLRAGLSHISPNVLAQRLRELETSGVVQRHKLPPPAASQVYQLSDWGLALEPVIMALGRWGARSPAMPFTSPTSTTSLIIALRTMFDSEAATEVEASLQLNLAEEHFQAQVQAGRLELARGNADQPEAIIDSDPQTLKALAFGGWPLAQALQAQQLTLTGDVQLVERFLGLFKLPEPSSTTEAA